MVHGQSRGMDVKERWLNSAKITSIERKWGEFINVAKRGGNL